MNKGIIENMNSITDLNNLRTKALLFNEAEDVAELIEEIDEELSELQKVLQVIAGQRC